MTIEDRPEGIPRIINLFGNGLEQRECDKRPKPIEDRATFNFLRYDPGRGIYRPEQELKI